MAFELQHEVDEQEGCKAWDFIDVSGNYNSVTNPTGYGSPDVASSAITTATLTILPYGYSVGWVFTFTIVIGTVTGCTVTSPAGIIKDILAYLSYTAFPFVEATPFTIIGKWLDMGTDSEMIASAYNFEFNISDGTQTYTSSSDELIVCQTCCCVHNMAADLNADECCEDCDRKAIDKASDASIFLDAAIFAMENGDPDKSYANLMRAKELCSGGCTTC